MSKAEEGAAEVAVVPPRQRPRRSILVPIGAVMFDSRDLPASENSCIPCLASGERLRAVPALRSLGCGYPGCVRPLQLGPASHRRHTEPPLGERGCSQIRCVVRTPGLTSASSCRAAPLRIAPNTLVAAPS